jgi:hypothetical protein
MRALDDGDHDPTCDERAHEDVGSPGGADSRSSRQLRPETHGDGLQTHGVAHVGPRPLDHAREVGVKLEGGRFVRLHRSASLSHPGPCVLELPGRYADMSRKGDRTPTVKRECPPEWIFSDPLLTETSTWLNRARRASRS